MREGHEGFQKGRGGRVPLDVSRDESETEGAEMRVDRKCVEKEAVCDIVCDVLGVSSLLSLIVVCVFSWSRTRHQVSWC